MSSQILLEVVSSKINESEQATFQRGQVDRWPVYRPENLTDALWSSRP